jgi:hypothetical protein
LLLQDRKVGVGIFRERKETGAREFRAKAHSVDGYLPWEVFFFRR